MKKRLFIHLLLLALLGLVGCIDPKSVTDSLSRAKAWLDEHPDSAWTELQSLDFGDIRQDANRARYALLYTQAQDKNYIDETNDSLITVAVDYYRHTGDVRRRFLSYYYQGRVLSNAGDYLNAISCYMEAEQLADEVEDDYQLGLLYAELGRIYRLYYDYPKSLGAYQKAGEHYERAGKIRHRNYMWLNQSTVCRNLNQYSEGEQLLREVLEAAKAEGDNGLVRECLGDWAMLCAEQNRMPEAKALYEELASMVGHDYSSSSFMAKLSQMYVSEQDFVQATHCIERGWELAENHADSISLYMALAELYSQKGNGELAYQELQKGVMMQNRMAHQALQQPILTAQRDYLTEKLEFEAYRLRMEKHLRALYVLLFSLLLLLVAFVLCRKLKKRKKVIAALEKGKAKVESENKDLLRRLDESKEAARLTIEKLKNEIVQREKDSNAEIMNLVRVLKQGRGEVDLQDIQALDDAVSQKEALRQELETLVHKLESDNKVDASVVDRLRQELEALQDENRKQTLQKVELLKNDVEHIIDWVFLHEKEWPSEALKVKRIKEKMDSLKKDYFAGEGEFKKLEELVNLYLDDVMSHFREEVTLANESDYRRVCYMFAGVSGQVIARLMGESKDVVYQRKSRLLKKVASLSCTHKDMFVLLLSK